MVQRDFCKTRQCACLSGCSESVCMTLQTFWVLLIHIQHHEGDIREEGVLQQMIRAPEDADFSIHSITERDINADKLQPSTLKIYVQV